MCKEVAVTKFKIFYLRLLGETKKICQNWPSFKLQAEVTLEYNLVTVFGVGIRDLEFTTVEFTLVFIIVELTLVFITVELTFFEHSSVYFTGMWIS